MVYMHASPCRIWKAECVIVWKAVVYLCRTGTVDGRLWYICMQAWYMDYGRLWYICMQAWYMYMEGWGISVCRPGIWKAVVYLYAGLVYVYGAITKEVTVS